MKIGIVTYWQSDDNYGQLLQCWALQRHLKKLGHEPFLIRYCPAPQSKLRQILNNGLWNSAVDRIKNHCQISLNKKLRAENAIKNKVREFSTFRQSQLNMSEKMYTSLSELQECPPEVDILIAGSDQVWAKPLDDKNNEVYFLNFGSKDIRKISYAASFSMDEYPEKWTRRLNTLLSGLEAISVREPSGKRICESVGQKATTVLDPTLLLKNEDYIDITERPSEDEKYIFAYSINISDKKDLDWDKLSEYAKSHGLKVKAVCSTGHIPARELLDEAEYIYPTIPQWNGLLYDSQMVVTSSFHGVAMSIILHKPFIYYPLTGKLAKGNSRVMSLLKDLDLEQRCYSKGMDYEALKEIDWETVDNRLEELRKISMDFLNDNLTEREQTTPVSMNVLYISNSTSGGGAPKALLNLIKEMKMSGHNVAAVLPDKDGPLCKELESLDIKIYDSKHYSLSIWPKGIINPFKILKRFYQLIQNKTSVRAYIGDILDEFQPDIVHTNVGPLDIAAKECNIRNIPHIWHLREYQDLDFNMKFFPSKKSFLQRIHSGGTYNIAITEDIGRHWNIRNCDSVIYDGIFNESTPGDNTGIKKSKNDELGGYFLYAARIEKGKGLLDLLKAFKRYTENGGKKRLLVAGTPCGLYAQRCRCFAKRNGLQVEFLGQRSDIYSLMKSAEAFIMCSRCEGFGFTTAEAMFNRCLVIGRDTGGTKEQLDIIRDECGTEVGLRFNSIDELVVKLNEIDTLTEVQKEEMRTKAFNVVSKKYSIRRYASEVEEFYRKVLAR